jgi:hypothetical protein
MVEQPTFATPEEAALGGYSLGAEAFVVSVWMIDDWHADVIVDTVPTHPVTVTCGRNLDGTWIELSSAG